MKTVIFIMIMLFGVECVSQTIHKDTLPESKVPIEILNALKSNKRIGTIDHYFKFGAFTYGMEYTAYDNLDFVDLHRTNEGQSTIQAYFITPTAKMEQDEIQKLKSAELDIEALTRSYTTDQKTIYEFVKTGKIELVQIEKN